VSEPHRPETLVERRLREAAERGEFDDLPGAGRPIPGLDEPFTAEKWALDRIRAEGGDVTALLSPMLILRKERARFLATVGDLPSEAAVRAVVLDFNQRLLDQLRRPMSGPLIPVGLLDPEETVAAWRAARPPAPPPPPPPVQPGRRRRWWSRWRRR
jgi:hypothetical protein